MQNILLGLLVVIAIIMIVLGGLKGMIPPMLTGLGFIIIAGIFFSNSNKKA